jgi:hypothetical protein
MGAPAGWHGEAHVLCSASLRQLGGVHPRQGGTQGRGIASVPKPVAAGLTAQVQPSCHTSWGAPVPPPLAFCSVGGCPTCSCCQALSWRHQLHLGAVKKLQGQCGAALGLDLACGGTSGEPQRILLHRDPPERMRSTRSMRQRLFVISETALTLTESQLYPPA